MKKFKKIIIVFLGLILFIIILNSYGVFDNLINFSNLSSRADKALVSGLNKADEKIDRMVEKQIVRTILNRDK